MPARTGLTLSLPKFSENVFVCFVFLLLFFGGFFYCCCCFLGVFLFLFVFGLFCFVFFFFFFFLLLSTERFLRPPNGTHQMQ